MTHCTTSYPCGLATRLFLTSQQASSRVEEHSHQYHSPHFLGSNGRSVVVDSREAVLKSLNDDNESPSFIPSSAPTPLTSEHIPPIPCTQVLLLPLTLFVNASDSALTARMVVRTPFNAPIAPSLHPRGVLLAETLLVHISQPLFMSASLSHQLVNNASKIMTDATNTSNANSSENTFTGSNNSTGSSINGSSNSKNNPASLPSSTSTASLLGLGGSSPAGGPLKLPTLPLPVVCKLVKFPVKGNGNGTDHSAGS